MFPLDLTNDPQISFSLYQWALLLYAPSAISGAIFDLKDRSVPLIINIPAGLGAALLLYGIWMGLVPSIDPWVAVLLLIQMVIVGVTGFVLVKRNLSGGEDMVAMILYAALTGGIFILVVGGIITFIHLIYRRLRGLTEWSYTQYSYYPFPVVFSFAVGYFLWLLLTFGVS